MSKEYTAADIKVLKGLDVIKKRPGMYIGNTDDGSGLLNMLWEVVSNSVDQFLAGHCTTISITLNSDNSIEISDDGVGISLDDMDGKTVLERVMTELHFTATFDGHAPHTHVGGIQGVGLSVVNALSSELQTDVLIDGFHWQQNFTNGEPSELRKLEPSDITGTTIKFTPSSSYFSSLEINQGDITKRLKELSCLNLGLKFKFEDLRIIKKEFFASEGICGLLDQTGMEGLISGKAQSNGIAVEVAIGWSGHQKRVLSYANQLCTIDGGVHEKGLVTGLAKALKEYCGGVSRLEAFRTLISEELTAVVHVNIADPMFAMPTRDRLINPEAEKAVAEVVKDLALIFFNNHKNIVKKFINRYLSRNVHSYLVENDIFDWKSVTKEKFLSVLESLVIDYRNYEYLFEGIIRMQELEKDYQIKPSDVGPDFLVG